MPLGYSARALHPPRTGPIPGPRPTWECEVADGSFFADASFSESVDVLDELRVEYRDAAMSTTSEGRFSIVVRRAYTDFAWVLTYAEHFADAIDEISLDGATLTASGSLYVNDPPTPGLHPSRRYPSGAP
jgi:hypothetical protein